MLKLRRVYLIEFEDSNPFVVNLSALSALARLEMQWLSFNSGKKEYSAWNIDYYWLLRCFDCSQSFILFMKVKMWLCEKTWYR